MKKKSVIAQELGRRGGQKTLRKYGRKQLAKWGKTGGRPKKVPVDKSELTNLAVGIK